MRNLMIGLVVILGVSWGGAARADKDDFAPVPKTGQVLSYDANTPQRDDGALRKGVNLKTPRFDDKNDGTVKDKLTGLIWLKNANCPVELRGWQQAFDDVASLNQTGKMNGNDCGDASGQKRSHRTDWRLPNIRELQSLVHFAVNESGAFDPMISNARGDGQCTPTDCAFSNFQASQYWSSTTIAHSPQLTWLVSFFRGDDDFSLKAGTSSISLSFVLAVRGRLGEDEKDLDDPSVPQTGQVLCYDSAATIISCSGTGQDGELQTGFEIPTPRFTDNKDGTIKDNLTGFIWLKNANCPGDLREWQQALDDVVSLNQTGKMNGNDCGDASSKTAGHRSDWRLPNIRELQSLIDFAFSAPTISNAQGDGQCTPIDCAFLNFQAANYWSSTTIVFQPEIAWLVNFISGNTNDFFKGIFPFSHVLAVRGG